MSSVLPGHLLPALQELKLQVKVNGKVNPNAVAVEDLKQLSGVCVGGGRGGAGGGVT